MYASNLAQILPADLVLMHALHVPMVDAYAPATTLAAMMEEAETAARKRLDNLCEELANGFNIKVRSYLAFGLASDLVTKAEKSEGADLIVLGTHGATNAIDVLIGTTASQIMTKTHHPTLVVPKDAQFEGLDKVGYATDFTSDSDGMIEPFGALMRPFNAEISVVHVAVENASTDQMANILKHFEKTSDPQMIKGENIPEELNAFIRENDLKLLAMKRHRYSWFDKLFHRSVTKQMVYHSEVPVLIFN